MGRVSRPRRAAMLAAALGVLLAACQPSPPDDRGGGGGSGELVQVDGVLYTRWTDIARHPSGVRPVGRSALGRVVARVATLRQEPVETDRPFTDNESNVLPVGTPLYEISESPVRFRLAAEHPDDGLVVYEASHITGARTGGDLLPLAGMVRRIEISDGHSTTRLAMIDQPDDVRRLVAMVLTAPVNDRADASGAGEHYVLTFHLPDGTGASRPFSTGANLLAGNIVVPAAFTQAIRDAVQATASG
jgi:hypothetical protein